ncbi:uncharacterized protein LOC124146007 [Haliotis rufescens]|uniref:uncharacterized protein LOC124146007 n=1 Tax=Haliotis rufescens TaxID=6454 RepID=UPI00201F2887|nr:uncharacterized protein LOC124146007 [Haliotis rufescens]
MMDMKFAGVLVAILVCLIPVQGQDKASMDKTIRYFADISLQCDSLALNISDDMSQVRKLYWILTDGVLVDSTSTNLPKNVALSANSYTLNITKISDPMFGYYHCVILFNNNTVQAIRRGVNVDGADFTELHDQYRSNALIGGIAAGVMVAIVGVSCLVWHFRFRKDFNDREDLYKPDKINGTSVAYDNTAVEMEDKEPQTEEKSNGVIDERL